MPDTHLTTGVVAERDVIVDRPDGTRIRALVRGTGSSTVLLLAPGGAHAGVNHWTSNHLTADEEWTTGFRSVLVDQRWTGASSTGVVAFDHELVAADHVAVLDALGLDRVHVVGVGLGAAEALAMVASAPTRVGALALVAPLVIDRPSTWHEFASRFDESMRRVRADGFDGVFLAAARDPLSGAAGPYGELIARDPQFREQVRALGRERYIARLIAFRDGLFPAERTFVSVTEECARAIRHAAYVVPSCVTPAAGAALATALPSSTLADPAKPQAADTWRGIAAFLRAHDA